MNFMNNARSSEMSKKQSTNKRGKWEVILHNDDVNSFDHVIDNLIEVCNHNYLQAVQCATMVHNCGKCSIFVDTHEECLEVQDELQEVGLTVTISKYKSYV
jgi:ATP-dependent Clp protease adaptor protein ClpS